MKINRILKLRILVLTFFLMTVHHAQSQVTVTVQPGPQDGFDTPIGYYPPQYYSTMNFSFMSELLSKALPGSGYCSIARSLLRFDLSAIPPYATIISAELSLYYIQGVNPPHAGLNASYLRRVTSPWTNTLVTWSTEPTTTSVGQATLSKSISSTQDYTIDVTGMVSYMTAYPQLNYGFELGLFDERCGAILTFGSSKQNNPLKRPRLVVRYLLTSGLTEDGPEPSLSLFPNPAQGSVTFRSASGDLKLEIYNLTSELIYSQVLKTNSEQTDLSHLASGIYIYKAKSANGRIKTGKLILQ